MKYKAQFIQYIIVILSVNLAGQDRKELDLPPLRKVKQTQDLPLNTNSEQNQSIKKSAPPSKNIPNPKPKSSKSATTVKPSEILVEQIKASLQKDGKPGFEINTALPFKVGEGKAVEVRTLAELLANSLGFLIEFSSYREGVTPVTTYTFREFNAPNLPGLSFRKEGSIVKMLADFRWDISIESVLRPKEGIETKLGKENLGIQPQNEIAETAAISFKNTGKTTPANFASNKGKREEVAQAYAKAIEKVRKDNGYSRAWFVTYRKRPRNYVPRDSPFWQFSEAWLATGDEGSFILPNAELMILDMELQWVKNRGQSVVKDALVDYYVVVFEDGDGKLAKTENLKAFL